MARNLPFPPMIALMAALALAPPASAQEPEPAAEPQAAPASPRPPRTPSTYSGFRFPGPGDDLTEQQALSPNEPMYLVLGKDGDTTARFQISFMYRIFDAERSFVRDMPWLRRLHLGYTQTSVWNLSEDSKPFEDTSYRPSLFWQEVKERDGLWPDALRLGYEHESNGQADEHSRSIDTLYIQPAWFTKVGGRDLMIAPKLYAYVDRQDNPDIADYRGHLDLVMRYGREDGWQVYTLLRRGNEGHYLVQLDLSYPLRRPIFARTGGYFYVQLFHGYGETLLEYDRDKDLQLRVGFAIVR